MHLLPIYFISLFYIASCQWKNSSNLEKWFSPLDNCILNSRGSDVLEICREKTGIKDDKQPLRCAIGNSWPSKSGFCSSEDLSFHDRKHFTQSFEGYDDPSSSPLKDFFTDLALEQGAVLLIGDSVMQQFFSAIACELERENVWLDRTRFTNTDETFFVPAEPETTYKVPIKFLPIYHFVNSKYDRVADASMVALRKNVENFVDTYNSVYIFINMGLHYVISPIAQFSRTDYHNQMLRALQYLNSVSVQKAKKGKIRIFWRETSAQHFPTFNGCKFNSHHFSLSLLSSSYFFSSPPTTTISTTPP